MLDRLASAFFRALRTLRRWGALLLALVAVAVVAAGVPLLLAEARAQGTTPPLTWHEALYATLGLFTLQSNRLGYPTTPALRLLYFVAPGVAASALLSAFAELLEKSGPVLLRRFRGHTVVGGLGNLGATIAREALRHPGAAVLAIERSDEAPEVAELRARADAAVLVGDVTSPGVLRRARVHLARRVFFTASSDVANLDAAFRARSLAREAGSGRPPTIYAHVYDLGLSDALEHQLRTRDAREADIVPFNSYRFAAKALVAVLVRDRLVRALRVGPGVVLARTAWPAGDELLDEPPPHSTPGRSGDGAARERRPTDGEGTPRAAERRRPRSGPRPSTDDDAALREDRRRLRAAFRVAAAPAADDDDPERFGVVGLGRFGRAVLRELLDAAPASARFLAVERAAATAQHLALPDGAAPRIELLVGDAGDPAVVARLRAFAPTAVMVCTDNDLGNLRLAVELSRHDIRTVTRLFDLEASLELGRGLRERGLSTVGLARLFHAAIPILTHERRLRGCVNLDVAGTPEVDHLFYLAAVAPEERAALGEACIALAELDRAPDAPPPPPELALVWYRALARLAPVAAPPG